MPHPDSLRPPARGRGHAASVMAKAAAPLAEALRQITVAVTPATCDYGAALLVMCRTLGDRPRELRAALSPERATLWRATTGQQIEQLLARRRAQGLDVFQDMPLFPLMLEGVERERAFTSQLGRNYRVRVFEVARWSAVGAAARERLWH